MLSIRLDVHTFTFEDRLHAATCVVLLNAEGLSIARQMGGKQCAVADDPANSIWKLASDTSAVIDAMSATAEALGAAPILPVGQHTTADIAVILADKLSSRS